MYSFIFSSCDFSCRGDDRSFKPIKNGSSFKPIGLEYGCQKTINDDAVGPSAFEPIMNPSVPFEQPRNLEDPSGRIVGGQKAVPHRPVFTLSFQISHSVSRKFSSGELLLDNHFVQNPREAVKIRQPVEIIALFII